eukprot:m.98448 g.98448  ORF g.98448 m.98448 type:complete len:103 (+) comp10258_c0_seq1:2622-2930(+)
MSSHITTTAMSSEIILSNDGMAEVSAASTLATLAVVAVMVLVVAVAVIVAVRQRSQHRAGVTCEYPPRVDSSFREWEDAQEELEEAVQLELINLYEYQDVSC